MNRLCKMLWFGMAALVALTGCRPNSKPVYGTYVYRLSTGEVELLNLENSGKFEHALYASEKEFTGNRTPLIRENGLWKNLNGAISLNMCAIYESDYPSVDTRRRLWAMTTYPRLPYAQNWSQQGAALIRNEDNDYVMYRIQEREGIGQLQWRYIVE